MERVYGNLAAVYDGVFDWALRPGRLRAVAKLGELGGSHVLEVGIGTGLSLPSYPSAVRVTGIDISDAMLARARQRARALAGREIEIVRMDAQAMRFADATFDHVVVPYVMSVVPEPARVMDEIARVCRPAGSVVIVNRFGHDRGWLQRAERWASPLSRSLGFDLDADLSTVTAHPAFELCEKERVNLFGWWTLMRLERRAALRSSGPVRSDGAARSARPDVRAGARSSVAGP